MSAIKSRITSTAETALLSAGVVALLLASLLISLQLPPPAQLPSQWNRAIVAHRGGAFFGPENSIEAFEPSLRAGASAVEFDLYMTKDNQCVVMHDLLVDRTTNGHGALANMTLQELEQLSIDTFDGVHHSKVPSCNQAIHHARALGMQVILEVKERDKRYEMKEYLVSVFASTDGLYDHALVASFDPIILYQVRRADPLIRTMLFLTNGGVNRLCTLHNIHIVATRPPAAICAMAPVVDVISEWALLSWIPSFLGVSVLGPRHLMVSPLFVQQWARSNIAINVWVVNTVLERQYFTSIGTMVTSDCPGLNVSCHVAHILDE